MLKFIGYLTLSIVGVIAAMLLFALSVGLVRAEHKHGHDYYNSWVNKNGTGCCNDRDCDEVQDRVVKDVVEVKIEGEWCPVYSWMYLTKGNAPNWDTAHACVMPKDGRSPCARLMCFQPKPGG